MATSASQPQDSDKGQLLVTKSEEAAVANIGQDSFDNHNGSSNSISRVV